MGVLTPRGSKIRITIILTIVAIIGGSLSYWQTHRGPYNGLLSQLLVPPERISPGAWSFGYRSERARSEVSTLGLENGWKRGYAASYILTDAQHKTDNPRSAIFIAISEYPSETATQMVQYPKVIVSYGLEPSFRIEPLPNPLIGDTSVSYKWISTGNTPSKVSYLIEFAKSNIFVHAEMQGDYIDYEILRHIAMAMAKQI